MEVAGQWRREWAGAAEYGKVTEGGVTRRVARALEVLNASRPGAQVRVMRAAWHSSAGPGAPASSYMMHSSRQFISSGSRLLTSPSLIKMSMPLEISSTPLDVSPDEGTDTENYKVTEPDDFDISEPSKWKSTSSRSSHRMPSEESSSTDNASIIDLDSRTNSLRKNNTWRRHSYDSENSDVPKTTSRTSPLLENPVTLSTLKYKSLLNNSSDCWHNRRKSYSFEDTKPCEELIIPNNDKLAMESSTDSGICKSTEIVNETIDERDEYNYNETKPEINSAHEESFKDWLSRNRSNKAPKVFEIKVNKEYETPIDRVSLQSTRKVSISLANEPVKLELKNKDDDDLKRTKRVEFCKTELHFAAESGTVNIISTDEKPPPSNDFRRRRSAFVPIRPNYDKHVTLFGDKFDDLLVINGNNNLDINGSTEVEEDENMAATKSILKNKIPKPKPYLLGENMSFGETNISSNQNTWESTKSKPSAVSIINKQLVVEPVYVKKSTYECREKKGERNFEKCKNDDFKTRTVEDMIQTKDSDKNETTFKHNLKILQSSPILQAKSRTRQLKDSDLTYFGIGNNENDMIKKLNNKHNLSNKQTEFKTVDDMFNVVRLVQQASHNTSITDIENNVSNYQNIPIKLNYTPVPLPRSRLKNDESTAMGNEEITEDRTNYSRRSRLKRDEDTKEDKFRSISEPPKHRLTSPVVPLNIKEISKKNINELIVQQNRNSPVSRSGEYSKRHLKTKDIVKREQQFDKEHTSNNNTQTRAKTSSRKKESSPLYVNINIKDKTSECQKKISVDECGTLNQRKSRSHIKKINDSSEANSKPVQNLNTKSKVNNRQVLQLEKNEKNKYRDSQNTLRSHKDMTGENKEVSNQNIDTTESKNRHRDKTVMEQCDTKKSSKSRKDAGTQYSQREKKISTNGMNYDKSSLAKRNGVNTSIELSKRSQSYDRKGNSQTDSDYKRDKRHHNREEYVINYDDKNGTFASINKIKHRSKSPEKTKTNSSRKKRTTDYKIETKKKDEYPLRK